MALDTTEHRHEKKILKLLKNSDVSTVVLDGKRGVGKTRIARNILMDEDSNNLFHDTLWLYMNNNCEKEYFQKNIARQLSLLSISEEWEDEDVDAAVDEEEEQSLEKLKPRISVKLEEFISAAVKEKKLFLLVLDDVPHEKNVEEIVQEVNKLVSLIDHKSFKVLITRSTSDGSGATPGMNPEIDTHTRRALYHIRPLSSDESSKLLQEELKKQVSKQFFEDIVKRSEGIPAVLITVAKAINHLADNGSGICSLESVLEEAGYDGGAAIDLLLRSWCNALPAGALTDCFWHTMQLLNKHGGVQYNELITQWILEGYFGFTNQIGKIYEQGHKVLMDLIDWGMLRKQEDNMVVMGGIRLSMTHHCQGEYNVTARLGLANVFEDAEWKGLGVLAHTDSMIKSPSSHKTWEKVSTLLMDGHCIDREVPVTCFQRMEALQVLMLITPRFKSLPVLNKNSLSILVLRFCDRLENIDPIREFHSISVLEISGATLVKKIPDDFFKMMNDLRSVNLSDAKVETLPSSLFNRSELRWLILKGCSQVKILPSLKSLGKLKVLDLSGATSFTRFRDKSFAFLQKLHTINLSNSGITHLPFLHGNTELNRLLLGGCVRLTRLATLNTIPRLQNLDLSGSIGLKEMQFEPLDSLKTLDLSGTHIRRQPSSFSHLSNLSLRDCRKLVKFPLTKEIRDLESLDLSGCSSMSKIEATSFQHMRLLQVVNFSKVKVKELPSLSNLANLTHLLMMDCSCLEKLPGMEGLRRIQVLNLSGCVALVDLPSLNSLEALEIFDVSGCRGLKQLPKESFQKMSHLRILNLSDTMIEFLPSICSSSNLCHLILRNCRNLKKLPPLEHLSKLEELNLRGAISLVDFKTEFLEHMVHLQILDLSGIPLTAVPSMSKLIKLRQFSVQGCSSLDRVPNLEALTLLEILDLSGTAVPSLPPLNTFNNLCQVLLKGCSKIQELQLLESLSRLEVLDLSGTGMKQFPYGISELTHLKKLYLPDLRGMHDLDLGKTKRFPQEVNWDECRIFECADICRGSDKPSLSVSGFEVFHILDEHPKFLQEKFKKFHFHVKQKQDKDGGDIKDEFIFRDVYFHGRHFDPKEHDTSLEIHGSYNLPKGVGSVLKCAECISLVDNDLIHSLSDLGSENLRAMKGCWLERCSQVQNILSNDEAGVTLGRSIETLWISNLPSLSSLYSGNVQSEVFQNLKQLYLDCCPGIINVFSSSQLQENLEILHVQFCGKLETLFKCDSESSGALQRLKKLYLLELPELTSIGIKLPAELTPMVKECPKLPKDATNKVSK